MRKANYLIPVRFKPAELGFEVGIEFAESGHALAQAAMVVHSNAFYPRARQVVREGGQLFFRYVEIVFQVVDDLFLQDKLVLKLFYPRCDLNHRVFMEQALQLAFKDSDFLFVKIKLIDP